MEWPGHNLDPKYKKDYRLILSAAFLYGLVDGLLFITLAIYVNEISGSLLMVGFIISLPFLAIIIMSFVWGAIADRLGSYKGVIIAGNIITGLMFFPMPFLGIIELFALRAVQVFFYSVNILAVAVVTEMLPDTKGEAAGTVSLFTSAGWLFGGLASGFIYFYTNVIFPDNAMLLIFPVCGVMAILTGLVLTPMGKLKKAPAVINIRDAFKLRHSKSIGYILLIICITFISNRAVFTVFPVYLEDIVGLNLIEIGVFTATAGIVGALVVVAIGRYVDRAGRRPMFLAAIITYLISWSILVFTDNVWILVVIWCIPSWAFMTISATAMISDLTSSKERGRGIGALNSAHNFGQFIGAMVSGLVASAAVTYLPDYVPNGFKGVFMFAAVFLLIPLVMAFGVNETLAKKKSRPKGSEEE